jgi:hypothetical protein
MTSPKFYVKSLVGVLSAGFAALATALADDTVSSSEWVNVGIIVVGAAGVFAAPNVPGAQYTKSILAVLTSLLTAYSSRVTTGFDLSELVQTGISALAVLGVYQFKNRELTAEEEHEIEYGKHAKRDEPAASGPDSVTETIDLEP